MEQPRTQFCETSLPGFDLHRLAVTRSAEVGEHGHRQQMRDRFLRAGSEATPDLDLLEMVLYRAIPRREVRSLAKRLLADFGDLSSVVAASRNRLAAVQGVGTRVVHELKIIEAAGHAMARARVMEREVISRLEVLGLTLHDHVIIGRGETYSLRAHDLI